MKKILLSIAVFFTAITMNAQNPYTVTDYDGVEITEGMVVEFNSPGLPDGSLDYFVTNNGTEDINMRIEFVNAVNANGQGFELCFGLCYFDIVVGQSYPPTSVITIEPGASTPSGNHFAATIPSEDIQDYNFRFYMTDSEGNDIGNSLNFTYKYDPTALGLNNVSDLGVTLASTVVLNNLEVNAVEEMNMVIYNLQGKIVNSQKINVGHQLINMSNLSSQMYIVKFTNIEGASKTIKVVKK
jgi:hypothetical protein